VAQGERDGQVVDLTRETAADGDDITVITHESALDPNRRRRVALLAVVGVVLLAGLIAAFVALRDDDSTSVSTGPVASTPSLPASTIATAKNGRAAPAAATKKATTATPTSAAKVATPTPTIAPAVAPPAATGSNPGAIPPSQPATHATTPPTVPKTSPLSALVWTAPANVSMQSGTQVHVTVSVRNPTDGTVTLPHPLSCTPRLQHDEVCPEMAQRVGPHQIAGTIYVLDATGVAPGVYRLKLEGVRPLTVTVTA
jgi:hypothetical protein